MQKLKLLLAGSLILAANAASAKNAELDRVVVIGAYPLCMGGIRYWPDGQITQCGWTSNRNVFHAPPRASNGPGPQSPAAPPATVAVVAAPVTVSDDPCAKTGHPVSITTGEKFLPAQDAAPLNNSGLGISRTYRSNSGRTGAFGKKWESNLSNLSVSAVTPFVCTGTPGQPSYACIPIGARVTEPDGTSSGYSKVSTNTYRSGNSVYGGVLAYKPQTPALPPGA